MALTVARMKRVDMVLLSRDLRRVTTALGRLGVLQFVEVKPEEGADTVQLGERGQDLERFRGLLSRLDSLAEKVGLSHLPPAAQDSHESVEEIERELAALEGRVNPLLLNRMKVESESESIQDDLVKLRALEMFSAPLEEVADSPFLYFAAGRLRKEELEKLLGAVRPGVLLLHQPLNDAEVRLVAVAARKGRFALDTELDQRGFLREEIGDAPKGRPDEVMAAHTRRLEEIRAEQERISRELREIAHGAAARIQQLYRRLRLELAIAEASLNFGYTTHTSVISGWLPAASVTATMEALLRETERRIFLQVRDPAEAGVSEEQVPILLRNRAWLKPFEVLVTGFGVPGYREVEPTLLMAVAFLLLYGVMFGDIGHGILLAIFGYVMRRRTTGGMRDIMTVTAYAGCAATLGGAAYGSVLGFEPHWLPRLVSPMEAVGAQLILGVPILFGILFMSLGVILNVINKVRAGHVLHGIVDRYGVTGLCFYWGALALIALGFAGHSVSIGVVLAVLFTPLVVMFLRDILAHALAPAHHTEGYGAAVMNGAIEVMETLTSYLANTVSFVRVGAFALAHAGLCMAIFAIMDVLKTAPGGMIWSGIVFLIGTALVVLFEGLVVFVQCLRLQYYEFFGKFFVGSGRQYKPFRIG